MNQNDKNDELEAQIRAALARKRQQQPARSAAPAPVIVSAGMVKPASVGQPAATPRPVTPQPTPQPVAQPTPQPVPRPAAPQPAGGMVIDPSDRLAGPAAPPPSLQQPPQQLRPRFATAEAAIAHAAATAELRQQPAMEAPMPAAPIAAPAAPRPPVTDEGRRALSGLLARSAGQPNAGDTQIPPPPGQVLGRIGVDQQPASTPPPKEKPFRHPFFKGKRHLWPMLIIPVSSIGVVLVLFYFLNFELAGEGVVDIAPLIEAEETPLKVRPEEEGGLEVENQDLGIFEEMDGETVADPAAEQLVPAPEQPVVPTATEEATAEPAVPVVSAPSLEPGAEDTTETAATTEATAAAASDAATAEAAATDAAATAEAATAETTAATETAAEPQPEPVTQEAALPPGAYRIQLAAVRSEDGARSTWQELQSKLPELADLQLHIERIDLGTNGIYYRVQGGPLPDKEAAFNLCAALGSRGQDCLVVKP